METVALFGGSFDPPHIGHEAIVKALLDSKEIQKVVVMPTFLNPFKSKSYAPAKLRLKWLKKIFEPYKNVAVDTFEIQQTKKVPTIESVKYLLQKYDKVYLVIGADNLGSLQSWYKYDELAQLVTFVVAQRGNIEIPNNYLELNIDVDVSSTQLRKNLDLSQLPKQCAQEIIKYYKETNAK